MKLDEVLDATLEDHELRDGVLYIAPLRPSIRAQFATTRTGHRVHITINETIHTYCGRIGFAEADAMSVLAPDRLCPACERAGRAFWDEFAGS